MQAIQFRDYETLSPFEIKDALIQLARKGEKKRAHAMLNAGRGNPNWVATEPREAFFLLGQFAITESKRVMDLPGLGGMPARLWRDSSRSAGSMTSRKNPVMTLTRSDKLA